MNDKKPEKDFEDSEEGDFAAGQREQKEEPVHSDFARGQHEEAEEEHEHSDFARGQDKKE